MQNLDSWLLGAKLFGNTLESIGVYFEDKIQAETLEYNAFVAEREMLQLQKYKKQELHKAVTMQRRLLARQVAITAGSGRSFSGSPLDVMARSESEALIDQNIIRANTAAAMGRLGGRAIFERSSAEFAKKYALGKSLSSLMISGSMTTLKHFAKKKSK